MKRDLTVGAVIVHENKVLLLNHRKLQKWLFPGGHIEENETPDDAVLRETKEETGLDIKFLHTSPPAPEAIDELQHLHLPFWTNTHRVGDHEHYCSYYLCAPLNPQEARSAEGQEVRWVLEAELEELNAPQSVKAMAKWALRRHRH